MKTEREVRIEMEGGGHVSGILVRPAESRWLLVLGHGAGAGMRHPFMGALAEELAGSIRNPEALPAPIAHRLECERRWTEYERNPSIALSEEQFWAKVREMKA